MRKKMLFVAVVGVIALSVWAAEQLQRGEVTTSVFTRGLMTNTSSGAWLAGLGVSSSGTIYDGSSLTNLNASELRSGTVPSAVFPAVLPAASGVNLTALNASQLTSGTIAGARMAPTVGTFLIVTQGFAQPMSFQSSVGIGSGGIGNGIILSNDSSQGGLTFKDSGGVKQALLVGSLSSSTFLKVDGGYLNSDASIRIGNAIGPQLGLNRYLVFSTSGDPNNSSDASLNLLAAKVMQPGAGAADGNGWITMGAGAGYLTGDATLANATLSNLSFSKNINVISGRKYSFICTLYCAEATAADGIKIDFGGGAATATYFQAHARADNTLGTSDLTTLTTAATIATLTGSDMIIVHGGFEPSSTGTFIPRFCKNSGSTGNVTVKRGSSILVWDTP